MPITSLRADHTRTRILIAEDEAIIAHDLRMRLSMLDFDVVTVVNTGEAAVRETLAHAPDIALLDILLLGKLDGIQAAQEIRRHLDIPVVFATASSDPETFRRARTAEPFGFVFKPFETNELRATLELAIAKHASERRVRESESRYRRLFENNLAGVFRMNREGQILDCNRAFRAILALPAESIPEAFSAIRFLADPEDRTSILDNLHADGLIEGREVQLRRADGSCIWGVANLVEAEDQVIVGTIIDITERKRIEAELSRQQQIMQFLVDTIPDPVYIKDLQHRFILCNPQYAKFLGRPVERILGTTEMELTPGEHAESVARDERHVLETGQPYVDHEEQQIDAAGTERWILTTRMPLREEDGTISGIIGIHRDITAQKQFEALLQEDIRFQQALLDAIPAPVFYADRGGRFLGCNAAFETFFGLRRGASMGLAVSDILPGPQRGIHLTSDAMLFANPGSTVFEMETVNAAGELRTGLLHKATLADASGTVEGVISVFVDLTDQHKLRDDLSRSEHRYRSMFENTSAAMLLLDPETGRIVDANPAAAQFYGYGRDTLGAMHIWDINPAPQSALLAGLARARSGSQREFSWKHRIASGEVRDVEVHSSPIAIDERAIVLSIIHDVTARKRAEEAQRVSDERFRIISESVPELIAVIGTDGVFQYASPAYRSLGIEEACCTSYRFADLVHPDDLHRVRETFEEITRTLRHRNLEHRMRRTDGSWLAVDTSLTLLVNDLGERFITVSRDITERRRREDIVRKLSSAVEHSPASIVITDTAGVIEYVNPAFSEITGLSAEDAPGTPLPILRPAPNGDRTRHHLQRLLMSGKSWRGRVPGLRKDGSLYWEQASISPIPDANGTISNFVVIEEDVSDQIRHEHERQALDKELRKRNDILERTVEELRQTQDGLVQSEKMASIGQLTAGIAHEINNPLAFVISNLNRFAEYFADTLTLLQGWRALSSLSSHSEPWQTALAAMQRSEAQLDPDFMTEDFGKLMQHTREGTERIKRIVEQLRGFAHVADTGFSEGSINDALEDTLAITWNELKYKATVQRSYEDLPLITCNFGEIKQVFVNLLVNAAQAIVEKGEINVRTYAREDRVFIDIQDSGAGISPEHLKRIFDPFFTTKPPGKGTGLGLWITTTLVQKHLGEITVRSEVGAGTIFTVSLPMHQPDQQGDNP